MSTAATQIARAAATITNADSIVIMTGAGVSAESGVPTFRDAQTGLWAKYDPAQLATPEAFARDPATVTRWYDWRRELISKCAPNAAHKAIARLQRWAEARGVRFTLITQNIDGLHVAAGSEDVIELHGDIRRWRCTRTGQEVVDPPLPLPSYPAPSEWGGLLRPCVVWFGEALPERALTRAYEASADCAVFLSVGTSSVVYPAAGLLQVARQSRGTIIEVNPEATPATQTADIVIATTAGTAMESIAQAVDAG